MCSRSRIMPNDAVEQNLHKDYTKNTYELVSEVVVQARIFD
jgi:hypothetical protein